MDRMPRNGERGFTLVEMLVIVLIVAILMAISLPLFINQRVKAQDGEAKTTASVAATALEVYQQEHDTYAGADVAALAAIEPTLEDARGLVLAGTDAGFTLSVNSAAGPEGGGPFTIVHTLDDTVRTCARAGRGGCPDTGGW